MYKPVRWLLGTCVVRIEGASPQDCLNRFAMVRVIFWEPRPEGEFAVRVTIHSSSLKKAEKLAELSQCTLSVLQRSGFMQKYGGLKDRIPFLIMLILTILSVAVLHRRVWFYSVEGNASVPDEIILRAVAASGVGIGTRGKEIVPQKVKDRVLAQIPELSWLTVRQSGCTAVITVREKQLPLKMENRKELCAITAVCPGLIEEVTVLDGSAVCKPGDTVNTGDILISAYVDLEYKIRAAGAAGEVYARTWRTKTVKMPLAYKSKEYTGKEIKINYLSFGKKRIKLSKGSGIPDGVCDKIIVTIPLTLPGGYELPISLIRETLRFYDASPGIMPEAKAEKILSAYALEHTAKNMVAGEILSSDFSYSSDDSSLTVRAELSCREMIGRKVKAEIFKED